MTILASAAAPSSPFLTPQQAADYLGLKRSTIDYYRWVGGGPNYRKHGGRVFYHIDDVNAWSAGRAFRSSAERAR